MRKLQTLLAALLSFSLVSAQAQTVTTPDAMQAGLNAYNWSNGAKQITGAIILQQFQNAHDVVTYGMGQWLATGFRANDTSLILGQKPGSLAFAGPDGTSLQAANGKLGAVFGTAAGTVAQGNDSRIVSAVQPGGPVDANTVTQKATGAIPRTRAQDEGDRDFLVTQFGAKMDGTTNDVAAINAAAAALAAVLGGGNLVIPAGKTVVGGANAINLPSGVHLRGAGEEKTFLLVASYPSSGNVINASTGSPMYDMGVSDLTIDEEGLKGNTSAIFFQGVTRPFVRRVEIKQGGNFGIFLQGVTDPDVSDNAITFAYPTGTSQNECIIGSAALQNTGGHIVRNHCNGSAIEYDGAGTDISFNKIENWQFGSGITVGPQPVTHDLRIAYNDTSNSSGIDSNNTAPNGIENWAYNSTIIGNIAHNNAGAGIGSGAAKTTIVGNVTYDNGQTTSSQTGNAGIFLQQASASSDQTSGLNQTVEGNLAYDNQSTPTQQYGLQINLAVTAYSIGANSFFGNKLGDSNLPTSLSYTPTFGSQTPGATPATFVAYPFTYTHSPIDKRVTFDVSFHVTNASSTTATGALTATLPYTAAVTTKLACTDNSSLTFALGTIAAGAALLTLSPVPNNVNANTTGDYYECTGTYVATQ